jgi:hypothetical protein
MSWSSLLENQQAIKSVFDIEPSLTDVRIMKIEFLEDGPTINIHLDLRDFPGKPPIRWSTSFNAVALTLQVAGAEIVSMSGWSHNNIASFNIDRLSEKTLEIKAKGSTFHFHAQCVGIFAQYITGYQRET